MVPKNDNNGHVPSSNHRSLSTASSQSEEEIGGDFSDVQWTASSRSGDDGAAVTAGAERQEGWEILPPAQVSFALEEKEENHDDSYDRCSEVDCTAAFHHSRSIPDLRRYSLCEDELEEECSGVMVVQQDDASTIGSSSVVIVPRTNCSNTGSSNPWASKLSFKDAILQKSSDPSAQADHATAGDSKQKKLSTPQRKLQGVRFHFQVVETKKPTIRRGFQSMPDLHCFEENVLGETDANPYYDQKSAGAIGRANGSKLRPDEKKRRQMILNKKNMQRQQQQQKC